MGRAGGLVPEALRREGLRVSGGLEARSAEGPRVAAVVLTWNDTELTDACLRSLAAGTLRPAPVILVDNGSVRPCGAELAARHPWIETVVLERNQGFTGGANRGLERALGHGPDHVLLLNNDTLLEPRAVARLVEALEGRRDAGAASALLLSAGDDRIVRFHTARVIRDAARHVHPEDGTPHASRAWPTVETEFAPACALLFRSEALRQVGLFDERFGTNWEDYDLCLRMRDHGWRILAVGGAEVRHVQGATTGRTSPYLTYYFTRNRLICLFRYGRVAGMLRQLPFILRTFLWQVRGYGLGNWACHRAFLRGVLDFALGVRGEGGIPPPSPVAAGAGPEARGGAGRLA